MSRVWKFRGLLWLSVLCTPATILTCIFLLSFANPMALAFLTNFKVSNQSGEPISITPVGAVGKLGHRQTLPLSLSSLLSIPSPFDRSFSLHPGQQRSFTYDWDDIQFSEILVIPASGEPRELVVDSNPTERQYRRVATNHFVIPELGELAVARPQVMSARNRQGRVAILWGIVLFGLLPPVGIVYSRMRMKSANKTVDRTGSPPVSSDRR